MYTGANGISTGVITVVLKGATAAQASALVDGAKTGNSAFYTQLIQNAPMYGIANTGVTQAMFTPTSATSVSSSKSGAVGQFNVQALAVTAIAAAAIVALMQ